VKRSSDTGFVGSYSTHHCETREEAQAPPEQEWNQETWSLCSALQKTLGLSPNLPVLLSPIYKICFSTSHDRCEEKHISSLQSFTYYGNEHTRKAYELMSKDWFC